ncbi:MAG: hypothetical protein QXO74_00350 [Candidatus Methanomethylicia archaeon]
MHHKKLSVAFFPLTTCSGCENAILDIWRLLSDNLTEDIIDIVYSPLLTDFEEPANVDVGIVTGSLRLLEDYDKLLKWRMKSKILIAFGSCSCYGGLPGLLNILNISNVLKDVYGCNKDLISEEYDLPKLSEYIRPLHELVKIDMAVPGCPPPRKIILNLLNSLTGDAPFKLLNKSLCMECPLNTGENKLVKDIKRFSLQPVDLNHCFLEQGVLCLGPVTLSGCDARCIKSNTPCRGCLGPLNGIDEAAFKFLSSLASAASYDVNNIEKLKTIRDLTGLLYRFTLPSSKLFSIKREVKNYE